MNFFEHQERARRNTWLLIGYFVAALVLISAGVAAAAVFASSFFDRSLAHALSRGVWPWDTIRWAVGGTLFVVMLTAFLKIHGLSSGGAAVASMMGGRRVSPDSGDEGERRLLNIVEEMALASGIAVPSVYVLPSEAGINAFAAGYSPNNAVVAVSRGALDVLTRDELQGVVAHEFSHIFNGDMRLNIRLIGILSGILAIAMIGRGLLRVSGRGSNSRNGRGGGVAPVALFGLVLLIVGYIGVFFAQLIKSAISRQREFLADASAVQFTRNPSGILGALVKIRDAAGSRLTSIAAEEVSHFLFAEGLASFFATHPPLDARIRAIDPMRLLEPSVVARRDERPSAAPKPAAQRPPKASSPMAGSAAIAGVTSAAALAPIPVHNMSVLDGFSASVGTAAPEHLDAAVKMLAAFPSSLRVRLATPIAARAVVYALVLDSDDRVRERQLSSLGDEADAAREIYPVVVALGASSRFPLAALAVSALRLMTPMERDAFLSHVHGLVVEDNRVQPFEFLLELFLDRALNHGDAPGFGEARSLRSVQQEAMIALAFLAHAGNPGDASAAAASFTAGAGIMGFGRAVLPSALESGPASVRAAFATLNQTAPEARRLFVEALAACACYDRRISMEEWETVRVFCAALECPVPPNFLSATS